MNPNSSAALRFGQRTQTAGDPGLDLESLDTQPLPNGCTVLVDAAPLIPDLFILVKGDSTTAPSVNVVVPVSGPGRWFRYSFLHPGGGGCSTVYTVDPAGTGTYPTVEAAITAANMNASPTNPITVSLCPGRYTVNAPMDITNNAVDLVAESEAASFLEAANPGVSPLLTISAPGAMFDAVRVRGVVFLRQNAGVLVQLNGNVTTLFGACVFLAAAPGSLCIDALFGGGNGDQQFVQCFIIGADPLAQGVKAATNTLFADCMIQGTPAVAINQAFARLSRVSANANQGTAIRVSGPNADLEWTDGNGNAQTPGAAAIEVVGDASLHLGEIRLQGEVGVRTPTGGTEQGRVEMSHVTYEGAGPGPFGTFLKIGSNYSALLLDCLCGDPHIPFEQSDTAQVDIEWGDVAVSNGVAAGPNFVRWVTSEQRENRSTVDVYRPDGANQLRMRQTFAPLSSADPAGAMGNIAWDANYIYVKAGAEWRRAWMEKFPADPGPSSGGPGFAQGVYAIPPGPPGPPMVIGPFPFDPANVTIMVATGFFVLGEQVGAVISANRSMPPGSATYSSVLVSLFLPTPLFPAPAITFGPGSFTVDSLANVPGATYYWTATA